MQDYARKSLVQTALSLFRSSLLRVLAIFFILLSCLFFFFFFSD